MLFGLLHSQIPSLWNDPLEEEINSSNGKKSDQEWISSSKVFCVHSIVLYLAFIMVL